MATETIRIGGASGFWGDAAMATPQLLADGTLDYIVYDYLAEITMSIMARARLKSPDAGYATDFVSQALAPNLAEIARQGVKIIANAGGVNPQACAAAAEKLIQDARLPLKVATIIGDDLTPRKDELARTQTQEMFSGDAFPPPDKMLSINAYLGAFPIARALDAGADIIITGRCVDSAVALGACIHAFGWGADETDKLAGGSLAGHILECGPQATGGNFTDWDKVADTIAEIGYPIAEIATDGTFTCTKPKDTGGLVSLGTIGEQMLYEIGDPQAYMLPDVVCDFSQVRIEETGAHKVRVSGAKGAPAPSDYKVSSTYMDGFRGGLMMSFVGIDAEHKARAFAKAAYTRARKRLRASNMGDFTETDVEVIGAESQFGAARQSGTAREVVAKIAAKHADPKGIGVLLREATGLGLATPPGLSGFAGGRPSPSPVVRLFSFLIDRADVPVHIEMGGETIKFDDIAGTAFDTAKLKRPKPPEKTEDAQMVSVPLVALAWGRSGDKGDKANIGILARKADYFPHIYNALTPKAVAAAFAHFLKGDVERFVMPGAPALNFLLHDVLGGGGIASLRNDAQGKAYAQILLVHPVPVPAALAKRDKLTTLTIKAA